MHMKETVVVLTVLSFCSFFAFAEVYVNSFDDGGIDGVYTNVDGSGIDVSCISINGGFTYLTSDDLLGDVYDYAYTGDYDYNWPDTAGSGVWMMNDHIAGDVQGSIIEFSDDVYFEQIWFAQAGDDYPVRGDVARVTAYGADSADWLYQASVSFDRVCDFNQWFLISPMAGFRNVPVRRLVLILII